jgi:multicomponent Na+:H+ antiporter subunit D
VTLAHLPALQVVVPLLAAPLTLLVRRATPAWAIAFAACLFCFVCALLLAAAVYSTGPISYHIGSWPPPWGIEYKVDALSSFVLVLVSGIAAIVAPFARRSVAADVHENQIYLFYTMYCLCVAGLLGMTITGDAFNLFVFMEIASLSSYVLIALGRNRRALLASYQYLILGTTGATFYVIGVGLLYLLTGTLNMADLAARLPLSTETRPMLAALAFITVGVSLKFALFPLHFWLPNAYTYAPSAITAVFAAAAGKVSVYVLLRFYFAIFSFETVARWLPIQELLLLLSAIAIVSASLVALYQSDLKRMFAYSSVAQIGYITLGLSMASPQGLTASVMHLFNHGITKGALFMLLGNVALRLRSTKLDSVAGLARTMPVTSMCIVIAGLSLIGVPGTAGFVTKWYLVLGAIEQRRWWLVGFVVMTSLIAAAYVWRFVEAAYLRAAKAELPHTGEAPAQMVYPALVLIIATIWFGLQPSIVLDAARRAVALLLGQAP